MAEVSLTVTVRGTADVINQLRSIGQQGQAVQNQVNQSNRSQQATTNELRQTVRQYRRSLLEVTSAISGVAAVASIFARNNKELKRDLEVLSLTLSGVSTAAVALGNVFRVIATHPILLLVSGIVGLIVAGRKLMEHWADIRARGQRIWAGFASWLTRLWEGLVTSARGVFNVIAGVFTFDPKQINEGVTQFKAGFAQIRSVAGEGWDAVVRFGRAAWDKLKDLFGEGTQKAKKAGQDANLVAFQLLMARLEHEKFFGRLSLEQERQILNTKGRQFATAIKDRESRIAAQQQIERRIFEIDVDERLKLAEQFLERKRALNELSIRDEIRAQERLLQNEKLRATDRQTIEHKIAVLRRQLREQTLEDENRRIEKQKELGQLSAQAEIDALNRILNYHRLTGKERDQILHRQAILSKQVAEEAVDNARAIADIETERFRVGIVSASAVVAAQEGIVEALKEQLNRAIALKVTEAELARIRLQVAQAESAIRETRLQEGQRIVDIANAELSLLQERYQVGQATLAQLTVSRQVVLQSLQDQLAFATTQRAAAMDLLQIQLQILRVQNQIRMDEAAQDIGRAFRFVTEEIRSTTFNWVDAVRSAAQDMQQSMSDIFFDTMRGNLRSLADLFDAVLSALQRQLANWLASQVVQQFTGLFGGFSLFGAGGGGGGGTLGIRPMQTGGRFVVNRPTLMTVGETGTEQVDVRPLATARQLPGTERAPRQILVQVTNHISALDPASFARWLDDNQDLMADSVAAAMKRNHQLARVLQSG